MRTSVLLPVLICCVMLVACNNATSESATASPSGASQAASKSRLGTLSSACEIFTPDEIKQLFNIAHDVELRVAKGNGTFPNCSYEWGKDLVVRTIQAGGQDIEVRDPAKLTLVVAQGISPANFDVSTSVYKDAEDMPGLGDMARWGSSMSQLSVLSGGNLFHINVRVSSDRAERKSKAVEMANQLLRKI